MRKCGAPGRNDVSVGVCFSSRGRTSKFSDAQLALALRQVEAGICLLADSELAADLSHP